jgi:hypothetical protein
VDDEGAAVRVEQRRRVEGDPIGLRIQGAIALEIDDEVRQVAGVRPCGVLQAMLVRRCRVVVSAGPIERGDGGRTRPDPVDVDPVETGGQPLDLGVDVDEARPVLGQLDQTADRPAGRVDERSGACSAPDGPATTDVATRTARAGPATRQCFDGWTAWLDPSSNTTRYITGRYIVVRYIAIRRWLVKPQPARSSWPRPAPATPTRTPQRGCMSNGRSRSVSKGPVRE